MKRQNFSFIEAPLYQGQKHLGVCLGPAYLRQMLLEQNYQFNTYTLQSKQNKQRVCLKIYEELSYLVEREIRRKKLCFIAGGDHSLALGSIQGALRFDPNLKVLWVDAHGDINTRKSSLTGAFHGMPLSFLIGEDRFKNQHWFTEKIKPENLIYVGVRDLDNAEKQILVKYGIKSYSTEYINSGNLTSVINEIIKSFKGHNVHISVDADGFDPLISPSTGVPVQQGLDYLTVEAIVKSVVQYSKVLSYEFVELNPQIFNELTDVVNTAQLGIGLFDHVLIENQNKEKSYGRHDRISNTAKPNLLYSNF